MKDYTITLTDTEVKSLEYVAYDNKDWIDNAAKNRARIAKEEILVKNIAYCNANNIAIACLLYTSPSPRDRTRSRMPSSA